MLGAPANWAVLNVQKTAVGSLAACTGFDVLWFGIPTNVTGHPICDPEAFIVGQVFSVQCAAATVIAALGD
jgi:hypothetical protein